MNEAFQKATLLKPLSVFTSTADASTCMMSEWITWSPCSVSCGMGTRSRERYVKQFPEDGSICTLPTEETEKCIVNEDCCEDTHTHTHSSQASRGHTQSGLLLRGHTDPTEVFAKSVHGVTLSKLHSHTTCTGPDLVKGAWGLTAQCEENMTGR